MKLQTWGGPLSILAVPAWAGLTLVVVASLMVGHWVSLPHPAVGQTLSPLAMQGKSAELQVVHFLYAKCACSRRIIDHLLKRKPVGIACERVVLVGTDVHLERMLIDAGYSLEVMSAEKLKSQYAIEAAPLMVVTDAGGTIRYAGGYTSRKQGMAIQDIELIEQAKLGIVPEGLPVYGCAVSSGLKAVVDPLGIK